MDKKDLSEIRKIYEIQEKADKKTIQLNVPSFEALLEYAESAKEREAELEKELALAKEQLDNTKGITLKGFKVTYSTGGSQNTISVMVNREENIGHVIEARDRNFKQGQMFSKIIHTEEIPLTNIMLKDLYLTDLIGILNQFSGDIKQSLKDEENETNGKEKL